MKLTVSPLAEHDLEAIGDWIAQDNPVRAISFYRRALPTMSVDSRIASTLQRKTRVRGRDQRLFVWSLPSAIQGTGY